MPHTMYSSREDKWFFVGFFLVLTVLLVGVSYGSFILMETTTEYEYEVKAEQVYDSRHVSVNDSLQHYNLTDEQDEVLYRAFKNTDGFLEGSSSYFQSPENYTVFDDWRVVNVNGVSLLVAIQKDEVPEPVHFHDHILELIFLLTAAGVIFTFLISVMGAMGRYSRRRYDDPKWW